MSRRQFPLIRVNSLQYKKVSFKHSDIWTVKAKMSNDGSNYLPWQIRKGIFNSTGLSDYSTNHRDTSSPIVEFPASPTSSLNGPFSPTAFAPNSPPVIDAENPTLITSPNELPKIHFHIRNIPITKQV